MRPFNTIVALLLMQLCLNPFAYSQFDFGVKVNFNSSNIYEVSKDFYNSTEKVFNTLEYASSNNSVSYGLTAYQEIGYLFFMADGLYKKQTTDYILRTIHRDSDVTNNYRESTVLIHLPIVAGILFKQFKFGVGPVFNIPVERNNAFEENENIQFRKTNLETGFQFLAGVKINNIQIDLKRELSFTSIADNYYFNGTPASVRISPNKYSLSLAYFFK